MKKLKLKALELGATELLTREQLKNVLGGAGNAGTSNACQNECGGSLGSCPSGCTCQSVLCPDDPKFTHAVCMSA